jgi:predicted peptidase
VILAAAVMTGHFLARSVTVDGVAHKYQVWVPAAYDRGRKWPAILFLHGSGERGDDGEKQTAVGLAPAIRDGKIDPQAIIVFPQCPDGQRWVGAAHKIPIAALDQAEREFSIDRRRVALTGMSMGGAGVWMLAAEFPNRWSAMAPVCGYIHKPPALSDAENPTSESYDEFARRLPKIPIWIFHGADDTVVPVAESRGMASALGVTAGYTEFAHVGHNAWDPAYAQTHVISWLIDQRRRRTPSS